mmetsp:Transcript_18982/g.53914  ORF Transcript_18982/g.53914 Transcript_18982/m.53914 type:complete len:200 (-) Transcript_18982:1221-1820(-)
MHFLRTSKESTVAFGNPVRGCDHCPVLPDRLEFFPSQTSKHIGTVPHDRIMDGGLVIFHPLNQKVKAAAGAEHVIMDDAMSELNLHASAFLLFSDVLLDHVHDLEGGARPAFVMMQDFLFAASLNFRVPFVGKWRVLRMVLQVGQVLLQRGWVFGKRQCYYLSQMSHGCTLVPQAHGMAHIATAAVEAGKSASVIWHEQ